MAILGLLLARASAGQTNSPGPAISRESQEAKGWVATIPLAADGGLSLFLSVGVNGAAPQWWALDSGASECIIDRSLARDLRLATRGSRQIHGTGKGTVRMDSVRSNVQLKLAGRALPTCDHFVTLDLSGTATGGYRRIAGILGYEFLSRYIVKVNFADHTLRLYDPVRYRYTGQGDTVALDFVRKLPHVAVRIRTARRSEVIRHLIVDTGSEDAVDDSTVRRTPGGPAITIQTTGLGKSYEAAIGILDTVRIGRSAFTNVAGVASDVGIVGNAIWSRFVCIFDYPHQRLFLEAK